MKLRDYLSESLQIDPATLDIEGYPDQYYGIRGAACWIYWPPYFFWGNPKDGNIYEYKKVLVDFEKIAEERRNADKGPFRPLMEPYTIKGGGLTHGNLVDYINYYSDMKIPDRLHSASDDKAVRGRSFRHQHALYGVDSSGYNWEPFLVTNRKFHHMVKKAVEIADKLKL